MKEVSLSGSPRENVGSKDATAVRNSGRVPCVVYGKNGNSHFGVYEYDFKNLVYTPNTYLVQLNLPEGKKLAKLQDLQFHPVSEAIIHADFMEVSPDVPLTISIPVNVTGNAPGVRAGGKIMVKIRKLLVKGMIKDLPDSIEINVDKLEIGQNIRVGDLKISGVELLDTKANSIISCTATRASISAATEAAKEAGKK